MPDYTELERRAVARVKARLLPFLFLLYLACWLDRVNVGFAALEMNRDLGFGPRVYGFGAGIFFLGYALLEVPSNLVLVRVGARRWIARIMISWGLVASAMLLVRGATSFYALRFVLGAAEAGFFPGIVYYLSQWVPARERARAVAGFMIAIPVAGIVGGPLAALLLRLHGALGLAGWQWLFLVEGLPSIVLGVVVHRWLDDRPRDAAWLPADERAALEALVARDSSGSDAPHALRAVVRDARVWRLVAIWTLVAFANYGILMWQPLVIRGFSGLGDTAVSLLSAIPSIVAVIAMLALGASSDRTGERPRHVAASAWIGALGFLGCAATQQPALALLCLAVASAGITGTHGPFWAMPSTFLDGRTAAVGIAFITSVAQLGSFAGPYAVGWVRERSGGYTAAFLLLAGALALCGAFALTAREPGRAA